MFTRAQPWYEKIDWSDPPKDWHKLAPWPNPERYCGFAPPSVTEPDPFSCTYVYFCEFNGKTKVGIAEDVDRRLKQLSAGNPDGLQMRYARKVPKGIAYQVERKIHERLRDYTVGREWFCLTASEAIDLALPIIQSGYRAHRRYVADGFYGYRAMLFGH